ncbi:MAG TPA: hypothetical protein VM123_03260 [archaeon]|nr:hypothetical protein [archaeon]
MAQDRLRVEEAARCPVRSELDRSAFVFVPTAVTKSRTFADSPVIS